ncbi:MAG: hypothetical protein ACYC7A_21190 [Thermoanaerobaculia bacterium]
MSEVEPQEMRADELPLPAKIVSIILIFIGLAGVASGGVVISAGTPLLYLATGAGFLASGILVLLRRRAGLYLFLVTILATVVWHVAVGTRGSEIARRTLFPAAIGAYLATPRVRMSLR